MHPEYVRARALQDRRVAGRADVPRLRPGARFHAGAIAAASHAVRAGYRSRKEPFAFRFPLLHRPLVEFMYALPWELKLAPGANRLLHREALRGILPEPVRTRRGKRGPSQPYFDGLAASRDWCDLLTHRPAVVDRGYVAEDAWRQAVQKARFGVVSSLRDFLTTAALEAWLRQVAALRPAAAERPSQAAGQLARGELQMDHAARGTGG
jgi:hypothetical protein